MIVGIQQELSAEWQAVKQVNYGTVFAEKAQLEESLTHCMN